METNTVEPPRCVSPNLRHFAAIHTSETSALHLHRSWRSTSKTPKGSELRPHYQVVGFRDRSINSSLTMLCTNQ